MAAMASLGPAEDILGLKSDMEREERESERKPEKHSAPLVSHKKRECQDGDARRAALH
jgi:hypothetical protein